MMLFRSLPAAELYGHEAGCKAFQLALAEPKPDHSNPEISLYVSPDHLIAFSPKHHTLEMQSGLEVVLIGEATYRGTWGTPKDSNYKVRVELSMCKHPKEGKNSVCVWFRSVSGEFEGHKDVFNMLKKVKVDFGVLCGSTGLSMRCDSPDEVTSKTTTLPWDQYVLYWDPKLSVGGDLEAGVSKAKLPLPKVELARQRLEMGKKYAELVLERIKPNVSSMKGAAFEVERVAYPPGMAGDCLELPRDIGGSMEQHLIYESDPDKSTAIPHMDLEVTMTVIRLDTSEMKAGVVLSIDEIKQRKTKAKLKATASLNAVERL